MVCVTVFLEIEVISMDKKESASQQFSVSEFKAKCLRLFDESGRRGKEYVITKQGVPIARVVPFQKVRGRRRGLLKGLAEIHGNIVHGDSSSEWEVLKE